MLRYCDADRPSVFDGAREYEVLFKSHPETEGDIGGEATITLFPSKCPIGTSNIRCNGVCPKCNGIGFCKNLGKDQIVNGQQIGKSLCCCYQTSKRCSTSQGIRIRLRIAPQCKKICSDSNCS